MTKKPVKPINKLKPKQKNFFEKYSKIIMGVLVFLFCIKTVQSCARKSALRRYKTTNIEQIDSLKRIINHKDSIITELNYDIKTFRTAAQAAEDKAKSIQDAVKEFKSHTTTTIRIETPKEKEDKDSTKIKK